MTAISKRFTVLPPEGKGTIRSFCLECVNTYPRLQPLLLDAQALGILEISEEGVAGQVCDLCGRLIQAVTAQAQAYTAILHFTFDEATSITATSGLEAQLRALEVIRSAEVAIHDKVTDAISRALKNAATLRLADASYSVDITDNTSTDGNQQ